MLVSQLFRMCYKTRHSGATFPKLADYLNLVYAQRMNRSDIGSWLLGPRAALEAQGGVFGYRGERLGLPESGIGAIAGVGRRLTALTVDWFSSILIVRLVSPDLIYGSSDFGTATLGIFSFQLVLLTSLNGASLGQKILGISVVHVSTNRLPFFAVLLRTVLLCLVIPALIWDRDSRGLHDKIAKSMVLRVR